MLTCSNPAQAMAEDAAFLAAGKPSIRLYRWEGVSVTLGRHQAPASILVRPEETRWAHRPTGGGAVLHGHDVTLTLALPLMARPSVRTLYRELAQVAVDYLAQHGLRTSLALDGAKRTAIGYCFEETAATDLIDLATGKKVCGCALRVTREAALLQTSIPYRSPEIDPASMIVGAKWEGAPIWRPFEEFDPGALVAWRRLIS